MQTRYSDEKAVRLSVRLSVDLSICLSVYLSVKCVHWDKTEERYVEIFYTIRKIIYPSLLRVVGEGQPLLPDILGQLAPVGAKSPIFNRYSLVALQS